MRARLLAVQVHLQQPLQQPRLPSAAAAAGSTVELMRLCTAHLGLLVTQYGRQPPSLQAAADVLRLLLLWLHGSPPAVTAFLRAVAQAQPFLVDSIRGSNACSAAASSAHPVTRGMLALLLGLCACYAEEGTGTPTQQQLLGAIDQQIGQPQFLAILDALLQQLAAVPGSPVASSNAADGNLLPSPAYAAFLQSLAAETRQRVTGVAGTLPAAPAVPQPAQPPAMAPQPPAFHAPPPPPTLATHASAARGPAPYVPQHARPSSPQSAAGPVVGAQSLAPAEGTPLGPARPTSPSGAQPPASVPLYPSASAAAAALHSPRAMAAAAPCSTSGLSQPPSPPALITSDAAAHLQQLVETLQR